MPVEKVRQRVVKATALEPEPGCWAPCAGCRLGITLPGDLQHAGARHHQAAVAPDEE